MGIDPYMFAGYVMTIGVALIVLPVWGAIDAALRPDPAWEAAGQNKIAWILLQLLLIPVFLGLSQQSPTSWLSGQKVKRAGLVDRK